MNQKKVALLLSAVFLLSLAVSGRSAAESYVSRSLQVKTWTIGPQPGVSDLAEMQGNGVGLVINTRRPEEMEKLDFDEAAEVRSRGMSYLQIPVGGDQFPFVPAMLDTFSQALKTHDGPVLLHCRSGYRVSVLAAAYLVREQGFDMAQAIETVANKRVKAETVELLLSD